MLSPQTPNPAKTPDPPKTHCPYCSLNCGFEVQVETDQETGRGVVVGLGRWKNAPFTRGGVCSKGSTAWEQVNHPERLRMPLIRRGAEYEESGWDEALDRVVDGFARIRATHGADANSVMSGGSLTNEKAYLMGKFGRVALGTRHVDLNGRMCMTSAGAANMKAFGLDRAMTPFDELAKARVAVVVGANLSASFPVMIPKLLEKLRRRGGRVIVIDPRSSRFVGADDIHLALRPGTDSVVANGLLAEIVRRELVDTKFVRNRTVGFDDAVAAAKVWTPDAVEQVAGVPAPLLIEAAETIGSADRAMYMHARGSEQHTSGTDNVLALINVALACGHIGRPGCGINMLTGQRNGQGGREMGQRCDQLPGARSVDDPVHRAEIADAWGIPLEDLPTRGDTFVEILDHARAGTVKGMLAISTNPAVSAPDLARTRESLERLEHLVVIDPFFSETCRYADVVLPGTTFAEEEGTITTIEGRVVRVDAAVAPIPQRSDIDIIRAMATRLGHKPKFDFVLGREVFEEYRAVSKGGPADYSGMDWERIRVDDGIFWPCPEPDHPGTPRLYEESFAHLDGRARFHAIEHRPPPAVVDAAYPFILTTGRVLAHYLSGNQTMRIEAQQKKAPGTFVELHPAVAAGLGLLPDDDVTLQSRQGSSTVPWQPNPGLRTDTVFMPYHWVECNELTAGDLDPVSKIPGFKYTPVSLSRVARVEPSVAPVDDAMPMVTEAVVSP